MKLLYRMHTENDRDELIRLWTEHAGWDELNAESWERRFKTALIAVAVEKSTDKIMGQFVFFPTSVTVDGREIQACRPFAPLLHPEIRGFNSINPLDYPLIKLYNLATDEFRQAGVGVVYMMTDNRWVRGFRFFPNFQTAKFPLWSIKLPLLQRFELTEYTTETIPPNDERLDDLWRKTANFYACSMVRNSISLPRKTSQGDYKYLSVFRDSQLVGFVASVFKPRDKQWLICDILAGDNDSLRATIGAVCNFAEEFRLENPDQPIEKAAILATDLILPIVNELGFFRDDYNFPFVVQLLDTTIPKESVSPSRWYLSAND